jgi:hypothetical protein
MDFLESAWKWVCGIATKVCHFITSLWNSVKDQVQQLWNTLKEKSPAFQELFSLKLFAKKIRERYDELCAMLSSSDLKELDDLLNTIDGKT